MTLGRIVVDLLAKTGSFETDLNRSAKLADKRAREIDKAFYNAGRSVGGAMKSVATNLLAAVGVTATVAGAFAALKDAIDLADETRDLSIRLGTSTETISEFRYAAQQTGTDMDALAKGMKILAKNAADALNPTSSQAKVFEALGVKVTDATGRLKQLDQLVPEIADKFKGLEDGTTKAALAQALFGKSGLDLIEFLNQGSDGLETMADKARELGIVIDSQTAAAADSFNDDLADLKAAAGGLALKVAKELLPELDKLVTWAVGFASDGSNAADIAHDVADGFRDMADALKSLGEFIGFLGQIRDILASIEGFNIDLGAKATGGNKFAQLLKEQFPGLYEERIGGKRADFSDVQHGGPDFSDVRGKASTLSSDPTNSRRIAAALGGGGGGKKGKKGKSDAEREAEQLAASYKRLEDSLKEQIALHGETTEVARVRYELENGELSKLTQAQKDNLLGLAAQKDAQEAHDKLVEEGKALTESLMTPTEQLNEERAKAAKLLEAGAISQEAYNRAIERAKDPGQALLQDLQFELDLLRMTNAERATAIQLRGMDAEQVRKYGAAILDANKNLQEMGRLTELADGVRGEFVDFFTSLVDGSKSAGEALKDFFDNIAAMITRMIAEKWAEKLFGDFGSTGQGTSGGDWIGSIFGALFGGGRASGGPTMAGGTYLVGERGPELFVPRTAGTVIPAGQTAQMMGGGGVVNNAFYLPERVTRQTQEQMSQRAGLASRRALARS